jgi:glutamine synthetase
LFLNLLKSLLASSFLDLKKHTLGFLQKTTIEYRNEVSSILENNFGFVIEKHHHEVATAGWLEIDFRFEGLVEVADKTLYYKFVAKNVAKKYGLIATFMPKPVYLDNASGMHVHTSLWKNEENAMYDENDEYAELSQTGRYFVGGFWIMLKL